MIWFSKIKVFDSPFKKLLFELKPQSSLQETLLPEVNKFARVTVRVIDVTSEMHFTAGSGVKYLRVFGRDSSDVYVWAEFGYSSHLDYLMRINISDTITLSGRVYQVGKDSVHIADCKPDEGLDIIADSEEV